MINYILKVWKYWEALPKWTSLISTFEIKESLNWITDTQIKLQTNVDFVINKFDRVWLYRATDEYQYFYGYVENIEASLEEISLDCKSVLWLLDYKLVTEDWIYMQKTVKYILNDLFTKWNTKTWDNIYIVADDYDTDLYKINFEIKRGETLSSIVDKLSKLFNSPIPYTCNNVGSQIWIIMRELLWTDYTSFVSTYLSWDGNLIYNAANYFWNTITNIRSVSAEQYNFLLGQNKEVESETILCKPTEVLTMEPICKFFTYEDWYYNWTTTPVGREQMWLLYDTYKDEVRLLDFDIVDESWKKLQVWDKVKVEISNCGPYLNYTWTWFIVWKEISFDEWFEKTTFKYWGNVLNRKKSLIDKLSELKWWIWTQRDNSIISKSKNTLLN